jgi:hypothetical protein
MGKQENKQLLCSSFGPGGIKNLKKIMHLKGPFHEIFNLRFFRNSNFPSALRIITIDVSYTTSNSTRYSRLEIIV